MTIDKAKVLLCQMYLPQFDEEEKQALTIAIEALEELKEFSKEEVETYIERNKEVVSEYTHSAQYIPNEREMIDVENFLEWLREQ